MGGATRPAGRAVRERAERLVARLAPAVGRAVRAPYVVPGAALAAFLVRLPGLSRPLHADEAGYTILARAWDPEPDSVYGPHFVARPPPLIALVRAADAIGGPLAMRVLGAVCCGLLVLIAAATARLIADDVTARWTALTVAAVTANPMINIVAAKGELLALPLLMGGVWAALAAVQRGSPAWALASGLAGGLAVGLKQNLWGSLFFAGALVIAAGVANRGPGMLRRHGTLAVAVVAGALIPVVVTIDWAVVTGVRLDTLWYTVAGFRSDAAQVLLGPDGDSFGRAAGLALTALAVGLIPVIGGFLVHVRGEWRDDAPLTFAILVMLVMDLVGLTLGADYWNDYLFPLVVSAALCVAVLARRRSGRGLAMRAVVLGMVVSTLVSLSWWGWRAAFVEFQYEAVPTGEAIAEAADPDDTLMVFGGVANLQYASGLEPAYPYLWSLQMRVLDPELLQLRALLESDEAPEWLVQWERFGTWFDEPGEELRLTVESRYLPHAPACGEHRVWLRADVDRPMLRLDCPQD